MPAVRNPASKLSEIQKNKLARIFNRYPDNMYLDSSETPGWASAGMSEKEIAMFQDSFVHVVTETVFYPQKLHLTEKIFRPIVMCRPFVLAGAPGNLAYLRQYGFRTFSRWWDESYDDEPDPELRLEKIVGIIKDLCALSPGQLQSLYRDMLPVIEHNQQHFYNEFPSIIVDELLDNFVELLGKYNQAYHRHGADTRDARERIQEHMSSDTGAIGHHYFDIASLNIPRLRKIWTS